MVCMVSSTPCRFSHVLKLLSSLPSHRRLPSNMSSPGLSITTFADYAAYAAKSKTSLVEHFLPAFECVICGEEIRLSDAVCCVYCSQSSISHKDCVQVRGTTNGDVPCIVCPNGTMRSSAGFLQAYRKFEERQPNFECGLCKVVLSGWDQFIDHYSACPELPADEPCCEPCLHPDDGHIVFRGCDEVVSRRNLAAHRKACPTHDACVTVKRIVNASVKQYKEAEATKNDLEQEIIHVSRFLVSVVSIPLTFARSCLTVETAPQEFGS